MMVEEGDFVVRITDGAVGASEAVRAFVADRGRRTRCSDRPAAEALADRLSDGSGRVTIQAVAPQDPTDVDAYLVPAPERQTHEPEGSPTEGFTFETSARQYGALGETLLTYTDRDSPMLLAYARAELDREDLTVTVDSDPTPVHARIGGTRKTWQPDGHVTVRPTDGAGTLREYLIEIKTGAGSLLRDQLAVMRAAATAIHVRKLQIDIENLPDAYTVTYDRVEPDPTAELLTSFGRETSLDEFD